MGTQIRPELLIPDQANHHSAKSGGQFMLLPLCLASVGSTFAITISFMLRETQVGTKKCDPSPIKVGARILFSLESEVC